MFKYDGRRRLFIVGALLATASCSTVEGQAYTAAVRELGKAEAAAALDGVDWFRCRASPVGAIVDRYGGSSAKWTSYVLGCLGFWSNQPTLAPTAFLPIPPPPPAVARPPFVQPGV